MIDIAIIGAGGFGREIKCLIEDVNKDNSISEKYNIIGFFDDGIKTDDLVHGLPVLGKVCDINKIEKTLSLVLGIGNPSTKRKVLKSIVKKEVVYPNLVHPSVIKSKNNIFLGKGNVIAAGCILTCDIEIKDFITMNLCCTIGHDTVIESYSSFMPAVNISGEVKISKGVYVGTGAKIINKLEIGENTVVGAGAVVSKALPKNCTAVGVPAKPIKFH